MEQTMRRVARSTHNRIIAGVCGGVADYAGWDPVVTRVLYVALTILSFGVGGVLLYLAAWIVLPSDDEINTSGPAATYPTGSRRIIGLLLIVFGLVALLPSHLPFFWHFHLARTMGPLMLIAAGVVLLLKPEHSKTVDYSTVVDAKYSEIKPEGAQNPMGNDSTQTRRLERSRTERKLAGICGGIGKYFAIDPTLVRLLWIVAIFALGTGLLLYLILWFAMPLEAER